MMNKSKKEIESTIAEEMTKLLKEQTGEHLESVMAQIIGDAIMVRYKDVLPPAERHLVREPGGIRLIKELKEKLIERAKPHLKTMVEDLIGVEVNDIHLTFNIETGEFVTVFVLNKDLEKECAAQGIV